MKSKCCNADVLIMEGGDLFLWGMKVDACCSKCKKGIRWLPPLPIKPSDKQENIKEDD